MAPVDAIAIPVGERVQRIAGKSAFERAETGARSWSRAPAPTADSVVVIERAAILHRLGRWSGSNGGTGGRGLRPDILRVRGTREKNGRDRSGHDNNSDHRFAPCLPIGYHLTTVDIAMICVE